MCVVNKQFELLEFVFNSVYVDLKYNEILLLGLCACVVCIVMWLGKSMWVVHVVQVLCLVQLTC